MNTTPTPQAGPGTLALPGRMHPVVALLAFVPILVVLLIAVVLATEVMPPPILLVLFIAITGCCVMLSWKALQVLIGGTIVMDAQGLTVRRLLAQDTYPWSTIDACKLMPATGTFGDDPLVEGSERIGVGLFLRGTQRSREHDLDADVILCAGEKDEMQPLMRLAAKVEAALKRSQSRTPAPAVGAPRRAPPQSRGQFQQRPAGATRAGNGDVSGAPRNPGQQAGEGKAKLDPVAQFRQRAKTTGKT